MRIEFGIPDTSCEIQKEEEHQCRFKFVGQSSPKGSVQTALYLASRELLGHRRQIQARELRSATAQLCKIPVRSSHDPEGALIALNYVSNIVKDAHIGDESGEATRQIVFLIMPASHCD